MSIPANRSTAVRQRRNAPRSDLVLDDFPTPAWATRALVEEVLIETLGLGPELPEMTAYDPCCGRGTMVRPLSEYFGTVVGTDIHDYGQGFPVMDYLDPDASPPAADCIIMNPPFQRALGMALRALEARPKIVAVLARAAWAEGVERYEKLFRDRCQNIYAPFVRRVSMVEGALARKGSLATAYAWFVWTNGMGEWDWRRDFVRIGYDRARLERPGDWAPFINV